MQRVWERVTALEVWPYPCCCCQRTGALLVLLLLTVMCPTRVATANGLASHPRLIHVRAGLRGGRGDAAPVGARRGPRAE